MRDLGRGILEIFAGYTTLRAAIYARRSDPCDGSPRWRKAIDRQVFGWTWLREFSPLMCGFIVASGGRWFTTDAPQIYDFAARRFQAGWQRWSTREDLTQTLALGGSRVQAGR